MGSDRARVSYDPSRHYRGVVYQQGRVTLEADWNEAETIAAEVNREQLLDIVGPSGTPDDGYRVVPVVNSDGNATGDLTVSAGTLYVGGERMVLDPDTMQLRSGATLQVGFQQDPTAATPCDPVAQGGYLGAENQLIRVQVAS